MPKCRELLLVLTADMCIALVRMRSVGVDMSIAVHMGVNLARISLGLLSFPAPDMCIAEVRMRSVGVDMSIAQGILMFIWG